MSDERILRQLDAGFNQSINIRLFDVEVISQVSKRNWDLQRGPKMLEAGFRSCRLTL